MMNMFEYCFALTSLDLSSFDTSCVTSMDLMFCSCTSLKSILVGPGWSTENVSRSSGMFSGCTSLVGGCGTAYSSEHVDAAYAHVDQADDPGYLTDKSAVHAPGWAWENGGYYYYENDGTPRKDAWIRYIGCWYYLGSDGRLVTDGWASFEGKWYYMGEKGRVTFNSWVRYGGKWYYMNGSGNPVTDGWVKYDGKWYYLGEDGNPVTDGWVEYEGKWYHLDADGHPETDKWIEHEGVWYHVNSSGYVDNSRKAA